MMLDTFDHKIWLPRFYDMDTICSYDNTGQIKFDVDIEMEQGYWNTSTSRLWTRIRDLMHDDLIEIYKDMRANGMSYESFMSYFYDQQIAQIPQSYYNKDADVKYLPFADAYIGKAHGDGYEHLKRWLKNRLIFTDTLFDYQPSYEGDILTIRANTTETMTLEIETYTPVYQHLSWYNGQMDKKKIDGKISVSFSGKAQASTDQEILIYGGTNVKSIKGISTCNPSQLLIGSATRLTELDSSNSPILTDINSDNANLLPHIYLNNLNLSDCVNLSGILKINNSPLIKNVDISNTQLTELQLPSNLRNLEELKLSDHIRKLDIKNAELLTTLGIPSNIEYLSLINMPKLSSITSSSNSFNNLTTLIMENPKINPISNVTSKAPNLQYVRLIGLNISCSSSQVQSLLNMKGIDSFGNEIPIGQAVSGKITLPRCSESMEQQFKEEFPLVEFIVNSYAKSYTVTFVDGDGNPLYVTQVLENGEAVYVGGIPTKTPTPQYTFEYKGWDRQLQPITSDCTITATFETALRYYTIKFINSDTLEVVSEQVLGYGSTPIVPTIPEGFNAWKPITIEVVTRDKDYYTQYVPYPEDLSIFKFHTITVNGISGYTCELKASDSSVRELKYIIIPFEYNDKPVLVYSQEALEGLTYLSVEEFYVPDSLVALGVNAFNGTNKLKVDLVFSNVTTFTSANNYVSDDILNMFDDCYAPVISFPKVQNYEVNDYKNGTPFGGIGSKLIIFGSPEYPFKSWTDDTSSSAGSFLYPNNSSVIVNLVTENGLESDVTLKMVTNSVKKLFKYTKEPMSFGVTDDGFDYIVVDGELGIRAYLGNSSEVIIPSEIKGYEVLKLNDSCFRGNKTITKISASTVTNVGKHCFYECTSLATVDLPKAISIGDYCFYNCTGLKNIEIPNSVTSLGNSCFYNCSGLTSIVIPNSVTSLGTQCFYYCYGLTSIEISNSVTSLGNSCFYGCSKLTSIVIPNGVTSMGDSCFYGCSKLASINIPNATSLGSSCFSGCSALTSIELLNGVTSIGNYCFNNCSSLTSIELPLVTSLGDSCFYGCSALTSIELPLATSLGNNCFNRCSKLASIELPLATSLGANCFYGCIGLTLINSPSVTSLSNGCFYECVNLTSIELPLATSLGNDCFYSCSKLASITLPLATSLGEYCFQRCSYLTSMDLPSITKLGSGCFSSCTRLNTVTFGYIGKPISDTSNFSTKALSSNVKTLSIYVTSPSSPPTLTGSPWGATNATITYEQA